MSWPLRRELIASLSYVMRTSPLPARNVFVAFAARSVLHRDVLEELLDVGSRLFVGLAEAALRSVRGEDVPLGGARAERVGRDHLNTGTHEVGPALDVLRVAVAHGEDDDGVGRDAVIALLVPLRIDKPGVDEQVDVVARREKDEICLQAVRDGPRLVGRGAVGLAEADVVSVGRLLPGLDDLPHHGLRRRIADQRQVRAAGSRGRSGGEAERQDGAGEDAQLVCFVHRHT